MEFIVEIKDEELPKDLEEAETDVELVLEDAGYTSATVSVVPCA